MCSGNVQAKRGVQAIPRKSAEIVLDLDATDDPLHGSQQGWGGSKLSPAGQKQAISMMNAGGKTQSEVAEFFNVHRSTISRLVSERRVLERKA
jgi:hypothetical protein